MTFKPGQLVRFDNEFLAIIISYDASTDYAHYYRLVLLKEEARRYYEILSTGHCSSASTLLKVIK